MQETWLLLSFVLCVSQSDIKIILLEITHLLSVIQDKATKKIKTDPPPLPTHYCVLENHSQL